MWVSSLHLSRPTGIMPLLILLLGNDFETITFLILSSAERIIWYEAFNPQEEPSSNLQIFEVKRGGTELTQNTWSVFMLTVLRPWHPNSQYYHWFDEGGYWNAKNDMKEFQDSRCYQNVSEYFQMPVNLLGQMFYSRSYLFGHIQGISAWCFFPFMTWTFSRNWGEYHCSPLIMIFCTLYCRQ